MNHLLSIESLNSQEILEILELSRKMKTERGRHEKLPLQDQVWALIFSKSSTRTRLSFETGIRELGGDAIFLASADIQLGRGEPIKDTARVMGRMIHGAIIRTFAQQDVEDFAEYSGIPTINALTDEEHPCQILADLFTIVEKRGSLEGLKVAFVGDGDCNVSRSWIWAAKKLGFELRIAAPVPYQPNEEFLQRAGGDQIKIFEGWTEAVQGVDVVYTDVWVSMGKEEESAFRLAQLRAYQVNEELLAAAGSNPLVMHCLPAYRGKEISEAVFEANADIIFDQAENRLHAQKAVLWKLLG